jgi:hypothetical protein
MLNAGWGCSTAERERKRNGEDLLQDLLVFPPIPCVQRIGQVDKGEGERLASQDATLVGLEKERGRKKRKG